MTTFYHAKYFAHELTLQGRAGIERLSRTLFDASVDLNPHQIEAAMFAFRSPLSKGVLLADEVGLGKTIEAALVLCQLWAERRRKLLVICPASIRKQWALELAVKFYLPAAIVDAKEYNRAKKSGSDNPFEADGIVIISTHFASRYASEIKPVQWDLVVIDEAHKLRNAYRESNRMGQNIRWALEDRRKILLTATPLQNSLLELYGLSTIIDEQMFGDLPSFRSQFINDSGNLKELRDRLQTFSIRTLRRQVNEYIQYTERRLITVPFSPNDNEHKLYEAVSEFLQRDNTYALPYSQRHLTTLIVRKLLASSPIAIAATMETMRDRLIALRTKKQDADSLAEQVTDDVDLIEELLEDILDESEEVESNTDDVPAEKEEINLEKLNSEIDELNRFAQWARSIGVDTKTRSLLKALEIGFGNMNEMKASPKVVIFTESKRTQLYLSDFLVANGYAGDIVTFNGTNGEPESTKIYESWVKANSNNGRSSGSRLIDIRTALIEHFRDNAKIMIATEAGAEGINLQFCSLVINYDLPWNPQRVEQRIGRCHRYGQKQDVVVINFLNERNQADKRVHELLEEKFKLFSGVFGASDEVLGIIESGVDFERRVLDIYQQCRTTEEIDEAFRLLREELTDKIESRLAETREQLLENFDEDVHKRLRLNMSGAREQLGKVEMMFWRLTKIILEKHANFSEQDDSLFFLSKSPIESIPSGNFYRFATKREKQHPDFLEGSVQLVINGELVKHTYYIANEGRFPRGMKPIESTINQRANELFIYRLSHPLGEYVIETGKTVKTPISHLKFEISNRPTKISMVESLLGRSGWLHLQKLTIDSFEREEHLLFSGFGDDGKSLDQETCEKLFQCDASSTLLQSLPSDIESRLKSESERHFSATISRSLEQNNKHFAEAREKLEKWADDKVVAVEKELKDTKEKIKALSRQSRLATTIEEEHEFQEKIKTLEKQKRRQRQQIFDAEDEIMAKRDELIEKLEKRMQQETSVEPLFTIRWSVV